MGMALQLDFMGLKHDFGEYTATPICNFVLLDTLWMRSIGIGYGFEII
jgi:hypothetical protein